MLVNLIPLGVQEVLCKRYRRFGSRLWKDMELVQGGRPLWNGHRPLGCEALHRQEHELENGFIVGKDGSGFDGFA